MSDDPPPHTVTRETRRSVHRPITLPQALVIGMALAFDGMLMAHGIGWRQASEITLALVAGLILITSIRFAPLRTVVARMVGTTPVEPAQVSAMSKSGRLG